MSLNKTVQSNPGSCLNIDQAESLKDYYANICDVFANKTAFVHLNSRLDYSQVHRSAKKFASYLYSVGVKKTDKIALVLPNCFQYPISVIAAHMLGAVVVNVNPEYTEYELGTVLADADVTVVVVLDIFAKKLLTLIDTKKVNLLPMLKNVVITRLPDLFSSQLKQYFYRFMLKIILRKIPGYRKELVAAKNAGCNILFFHNAIKSEASSNNKSFVIENITRNDLAFLQYTGGTTGKPKAAMLSHGNLLANISQLTQQFGSYFDLGKEVNVVALPMYHIFSLTVNLLFAINFGCKNILITDPRDLNSLVKQIKPYQVNIFSGVNTLFSKLAQHRLFGQLDFSSLKFCVAGGMALQEQVASTWKALTGHPILEGYGLTEASPVVCMNSLDNSDYNRSIGFPLPETQIVFFDENLQPLPQGQLGELAVKGPQVMLGYWKREDETKKILTSDGYLLTGDIGYQDQSGLIYLKERKKDIIIVSGFNVYPNEVESALAMHDAIAETAVVGIASSETGNERIVAFVVLEPGLSSRPSQQSLNQHCAKFLAKYKIPKEIIFTDELPKTNVGKVLRRKLREQYKGMKS